MSKKQYNYIILIHCDILCHVSYCAWAAKLRYGYHNCYWRKHLLFHQFTCQRQRWHQVMKFSLIASFR